MRYGPINPTLFIHNRARLAKLEDDFWASKTGQKLLRDRVERSFPEFINRAPTGMLTELGLKRHYKTPEAVKVLRPLTPQKRS